MMGGIAGHAGLFSTGGDVHQLMHRLAFAAAGDPWVNASTIATFTTVANASFSSRALGWDTNLWDDILQVRLSRPMCGVVSCLVVACWLVVIPLALCIWPCVSQPNQSCGRFSPATWFHTGYTGTQVCVDPNGPTGSPLVAILLTNRVYPAASDASKAAIKVARIAFSNTVLQVLDGVQEE